MCLRHDALLKRRRAQSLYVWSAVGLCALLLLAAVYLPGFSAVLKLTHPRAEGWLLHRAARRPIGCGSGPEDLRRNECRKRLQCAENANLEQEREDHDRTRFHLQSVEASGIATANDSSD